MAYAHSANARGQRHDLVAHLRSVGLLTAQFAEKLGARDAGYWLGLWHDIGKFDPAWQAYLLACEANPGAYHGRVEDPETMQGLVTDVSLKRKVRDWVDASRGDEGSFKIYVQSGEALNTKHERAYTEQGMKSTGVKQDRTDVDRARAWMCANFYDIRMFGAVMSTGVNCGQVRGPVQLTFARSIDPVVTIDLSITRVAVTRPEDAKVAVAEDTGAGAGGKQSEMGRKAIVPYGLYRAHGFFNAPFAEKTGATEEDLGLFWDALQNMWDLDRSSSRGLMACQGLYVFSHERALGSAPAHRLFDLVEVPPSEKEAPRSFHDYRVTVHEERLPTGVTLSRLVD